MQKCLSPGRNLGYIVFSVALSLTALPAASQNIEDLSDSPAAARGLGAEVVGRPGASSAIPLSVPSLQTPALRGATAATGGAAQGTVLTQSARPTVPPEPNEFQQFLFATTGQRLPLYGQEFFLNPPSTFAPVMDAPVAPDYAVGPGDEIVVRAWGQIEVNLRLTVDRNGMLVIPKVGAVAVGGMRYQDLQAAVHGEMSKVFRNFELAVTMGQLRGIQIFVVGQARQPGSYTVGSMSTLINALFAAGGPSSKGSMRRIQVKRGNKVITEFDLYDMLLKGDTSKDVRLRQGDVIVIPSAGHLVAVNGSISQPAVYELGHEDTGLKEVLDWAGGLTTITRGQKATVERIDGRESRNVSEFKLDTAGLQQTLRDGDLVTLFAISPKFDNAVTVRGFVAQSARHPWREGLRVRDLLPDANAVTSPEYWQSRNRMIGTGASFYMQSEPEALTSAEQQQLKTRRYDDRTGRYDDRTGRYDPALANRQEVSWDYAVVERLKPDTTTELIPFNLGLAIISGDPKHNLMLRPGDTITVFSKADLRVPQENQRRYVRLEGEFRASGVYSVKPGETLRQLVTRIGGVTPAAYLFGAEFTRESARQLQQLQLEESLARMERELQRASVTAERESVTAETAQSRRNQVQAQQAMISKMKTVKATGRIVLNADTGSFSIRDLPDLPLEDGDRFYVPPRPSVVSVFGSVVNPNTFVYQESRRVDEYLAQAGGPTRSADAGSLYLLRANGSVASERQSGWFSGVGDETLMPGDAVIVPEDFERYALSRDLKDWSQIFYQFALGVAGLKVLKN